MSVEVLLSELSQLGVTLRLAENAQLAVDAPRGRLSATMLDRIRERKPELVRWLSASAGAPAEALPQVVPDRAALHEPFPPADLQAAFLMGERPDMEHHVRPHYYGEWEHPGLDPVRYEAALRRVLARQAANLPVVTDDLQLVVPRTLEPLEVPVHDLRALGPAEAERAMEQTRARMARGILPLDRWPWMACEISLYGEGRARIHFNNNNVFSDGYGTSKLLKDALRCHDDPSAELPPLSLGFRDCVQLLARIERSPKGEASRRYWLDRIPHLPAALALPVRAGFDPRTRSRLQRREVVIPAATWSAIKAHGRARGLTPTNALYAIYAELVASWGGSRHFLLNNMVTHRFPIHPEINEILGNFASLYPLEVDWRGALPFYERAQRLQTRLMADLDHVYWSGVSVLQALNQAQHSTGRATVPFVIGSGLFMGPYTRPHWSCLETSQVKLDYQFWELTDGSLWYVWDLIEEAFPAGFIDAMSAAHVALLEEFAGAGAWEATGTDPLPAQQRAVRARVNETREAIAPRLLHAALPEAAGTPGRAAVITSSGTRSWSDVLVRADAIAARLRAGGLTPGDRVAVVLPKCADQIAAVFGTLRAGGAYVPVDPTWPAERAQVVLRSAGVRQVLTSARLRDEAGRFPAEVAAIAVEELAAAAAPLPAAPGRSPGDLAYIIFTSGSTGTPKGVAISHDGAWNTIADVNRRFGVHAGDRILAVSTLSFDLSVWDLFGAAAAGAALVVPEGPEVGDPRAWLELMQRRGVTIWNSAPALMQLLVDAAIDARVELPALRLVLLSGDWIPVTLPEQIRRVAPGARVVSLGGATEASIWSIFYPVEQVDPAWPSIPYGKPLANQTWHVLDDAGADAPDWVPGHLHIGGRGLALEYWGDAEKTAAAFVPHPRTGERLYRTGDMGRYLPDGTLEFLGRRDQQVKIQGFRIELGDVEHALAAHPAVAAAVALVQGGQGGGKQLAAFAVRRPGHAVDADALLAHARAKLPPYMVPTSVTFLEQLPLGATGKVDRAALRAAAAPAAALRPAYRPPGTEAERALAAIWEDVLGVRPVGADDDFFELGGQSFAALRVLTRVARQLGRSLSLGTMLQGRTVARLAQVLERVEDSSPLVTLRAEGVGTPWFFAHPAGGNVLCYRRLAETLGVPFFAFQAAGLDGGAAPAASIEVMAAAYVAALRRERPHGPYVVGGWSSGGVIAHEMARLLEAGGERVERVILLDTPAPLQGELPPERALVSWFVEDLALGPDAARAAAVQVPEGLPAQAMLEAVLAGLHREGAITAPPDAKQLAPVFAVFQAVVTACRAHRAAPVAADLLVVRAREGRVTEFLRHPADADPAWGWGRFTHGRADACRTPGSHHTLLAPEHLGALTAELEKFRPNR